MVRFIDISSWQGDISLSPLPIDGAIVKATEGETYVNPYCDTKVQEARQIGLLWGFYHYAKNGNPIDEAQFFVDNCLGYFGEGVPVLDWEESQTVEWVNDFVQQVHKLTGVWCWIYANPWRFNQGGVESNCARWVAEYPNVYRPSIDYDPGEPPYCDGLVCAWQYASDGIVPGYEGDLDVNVYYGDADSWRRYANPSEDDKLYIDRPACDNNCCPCCHCKKG